MIKPHRQLFDRLGPDPGPAVLLDTPYGFQDNADDISARAVEYFAASVGRPVEPVELRRVEGADPVRTEAALARLAARRLGVRRTGQPDLRPPAMGGDRRARPAGRQTGPRRVAWSSPAPPP